MAPDRPPAPVCAPDPGARPPAPVYRIDPVPHLVFARMVARVVRRRSGFRMGSPEEEELELVAYVELCYQAIRFDPARTRADSTPGEAFRGWCKRAVMTACVRAALKLKRGGLTHVPDGARAVRCANCSDVVWAGVVDPIDDDEEDE